MAIAKSPSASAARGLQAAIVGRESFHILSLPHRSHGCLSERDLLSFRSLHERSGQNIYGNLEIFPEISCALSNEGAMGRISVAGCLSACDYVLSGHVAVGARKKAISW